MKKKLVKNELEKTPFIIIKSKVTRIFDNSKKNRVLTVKTLGNIAVPEFPFYKEITRSYG